MRIMGRRHRHRHHRPFSCDDGSRRRRRRRRRIGMFLISCINIIIIIIIAVVPLLLLQQQQQQQWWPSFWSVGVVHAWIVLPHVLINQGSRCLGFRKQKNGRLGGALLSSDKKSIIDTGKEHYEYNEPWSSSRLASHDGRHHHSAKKVNHRMDNNNNATLKEEEIQLKQHQSQQQLQDDEDWKIGKTLLNVSSLLVAATTTKQMNVSYFYLKHDLGLDDDAMFRITTLAGSALGMTIVTIREKVQVLRRILQCSDADLRTILTRHSTILHLSARDNILPKLLYLLGKLQLDNDNNRSQLCRLVVSCPCILSYNMVTLQGKIHFWTNYMQFSIAQTRDILLREPNLLRSSVQHGLLPHVHFLVQEIEIPTQMLQDLIMLHPRILMYSLEDNLIPKLIFYCIMTLQMTTTQVQRLLLSYPAILAYNLDRHLLPTTLYFLHDLGYCHAEFCKILLSHPRIMTHSLSKVQRVVGYFRHELGMQPSQVKRILYQAPQVLGLNFDVTLKNKVHFLQSTLNLTTMTSMTTNRDDDADADADADDNNDSDNNNNNGGELQRVIAGMPTLLLLNSETNLLPKIECLQKAFFLASKNTDRRHLHHGTTSETSSSSNNNHHNSENQSHDYCNNDTMAAVRDAVLRSPTLLGYSLNKRLQPRLQAIMDAGLDPRRCITVAMPLKDMDFQKWLQNARQKKLRNDQEEEAIAPSSSWALPQQRGGGVSSWLPLLPPAAVAIPRRNTNSTMLLLLPPSSPRLLLPPSTPTSNRSGRIVHWTRPLSPPLDGID